MSFKVVDVFIFRVVFFVDVVRVVLVDVFFIFVDGDEIVFGGVVVVVFFGDGVF